MKTSRHQELTRQGWERQVIYDEPRLSEIAEMYREIGLEVHLEPFHPGEEVSECSECMKSFPEKYQIVYTRKKVK
ncbi:MAG: hypothetical protein Q8P24_03520 [Desulfobacterales bacterium]|nr:hypothetical protein [Desulfobacterales bacterium]